MYRVSATCVHEFSLDGFLTSTFLRQRPLTLEGKFPLTSSDTLIKRPFRVLQTYLFQFQVSTSFGAVSTLKDGSAEES